MARSSSTWKPGQSGNPKGRPRKNKTLTEILAKHGKKRDVKDGEKNISRKEALAKKLWALALSGDIAAIRYIYDRIDGKPDQYHQMDLEHSAAENLLEALKEAHARREDESDR
ncbi:MAG: hypothetical protein JXB88_03285 [Spirochaetales bacterium]|nr:hypothetical protein [Spirochaetales bacterium]